uniref:E3 ubiquitin-protein ligase RFI2 isoform X2 n=1 Tax=Erigeron canadensis TaxID=72917 RepID=UPI001CB95DD9|nr:E3 ubiquitin-protein ligase RFI2 isoform X2 [Erigeron canadensis]
MLTSKIDDVINAADNSPSSSVPCSICFDLVIDDGVRSIAKLHCGHKFHLDCIGSAFNTKGTMQCPNCRKVESGRWLFADGSSHANSETGAPDWLPNEVPHDLSYFRMPFGFPWCPFSGFMVQSSFEEAESSLNAFANFHGAHAIITEHTAGPSFTRSYVSHFRPGEHVGNSNFHHPLNALSVPHNNIRSTNIQHPSWGWNCHFLPYDADRDYLDHGNQPPQNLRSAHSRMQVDIIPRSPSFLHPLRYTQHGESSVANSQSHERIPVLHTSYHQEQPGDVRYMPPSTNGFGRFSGARGLPMILLAVPGQPHHHGSHGFYSHEVERDELSYVPILQESSNHRISRSSDYGNQAHWS